MKGIWGAQSQIPIPGVTDISSDWFPNFSRGHYLVINPSKLTLATKWYINLKQSCGFIMQRVHPEVRWDCSKKKQPSWWFNTVTTSWSPEGWFCPSGVSPCLSPQDFCLNLSKSKSIVKGRRNYGLIQLWTKYNTAHPSPWTTFQQKRRDSMPPGCKLFSCFEIPKTPVWGDIITHLGSAHQMSYGCSSDFPERRRRGDCELRWNSPWGFQDSIGEKHIELQREDTIYRCQKYWGTFY